LFVTAVVAFGVMYTIGTMWKPSQHGFTLVELLITIAIIGILAMVVLTSLNDARIQGINAKIETEMDAIAKRAEVEHIQSLTYDSVCGSNDISQSPDILRSITSINTFASSTLICNSQTTSYAISVPINTTHWCIDSLGTKKEIPAALDDTDGAEKFFCP
jgi:prepilin-type N-terminal cleavage/methylation domain-containing protein